MIKNRNCKRMLVLFLVSILLLFTIPIQALEAQQSLDSPKTGFEISNGDRWTTHQEELDFLEEVSRKSERVRYSQIGTSGEGRSLHLVRVGNPLPATDAEIASGRSILITGTFHGNEPSGREMSLKLIRDLAYSEDPKMLELMGKATVLFIPTVNPDGREANIRRNKDDFDLNRDAVSLVTPEVQTLAKVQKQFKPDIVLDAHERTSGPNMSVLGNLNLNVDKALQELNQELITDYIFRDLAEADVTFEFYPPGGLPTNTRSMAGLKHSIAILTEASWDDEPLVRVNGQMVAANSILNFYHERFNEVVDIVTQAPTNKRNDGANREPFFLDGYVGGPAPTRILNPGPCGYLINPLQAEKVRKQIDLFSLETQVVKDGSIFIPMNQPMMTVIPYIFDESSELKLVNGLAVEDCSALELLEPPSIPTSALFQTDFTGYDSGVAPQDWTSVWKNSSWMVQDEPHRLEHMVTDGDGHRLLVWNEVGEVHGDVEVAGLVRANRDGELFQIHLHGYGQEETESSYYLNVTKQNNNNTISINRLLRNRDTVLKSEALPFQLNVDTWYQVVFQRDGNTLNGKVWRYGEEEPDWQISVDDEYLGFGNVGIGHRSTGLVNDWKFFSVGTYGQEAQRAPGDLIDGVDKSVLQRRVDKIKSENLEEVNFSPESWANLQGALVEAEDILNQSDATQEEVDRAVEHLNQAYLALSSKYETDFSEYEVGGVPSHWSTLWRESGWTIKDKPSRLEHVVTEGGGRRVLSWDKAGDVNGDVEVSTVVRRVQTDQSEGVMFQLHLQGSGNAGSESSYYLDLTNGGYIRINRNMNGSFKVLKSVKQPLAATAGTWYQVVFKREGTSLKGKIWLYGEEEPEAWQVEVEDDSFSRGKVGVGHVTSGVINEWAFIGVGAGDMEAPRAPEDLFDPTEIEVDKTRLEQAVTSIKSGGLNETDYTTDSWQNLQAALSAAEGLLNKADATQLEVDTALENLNQAYLALQMMPKQYETDFSVYEAGGAPTDWSTLWRESGWTVKEEPIRLEHDVTEGGGRRVLTWDKVGEVNGDVEVSTVVRSKTNGTTMFQVHLHGSGNAGSENSYYLDLRNSGDVRINRNMNAYFTVLKSVEIPIPVQKDTWYEVVFKREGSTLKGKVWLYGEQEPDAWQVEVDDENFVNGKVGVGHVTSGMINDWAYFGVGTGSMEAPRAPAHLFEPSEPGVDKSELQAKVDEINGENLNEADYTAASWQGLQEKLAAAQAVLAKEDATQEEVDAAKTALETARTALVPSGAALYLTAPSSVTEGSSFSVSFYVYQAQDLYGASIQVSYDASKLEPLDADPLTDGIQMVLGDWLQGATVVNEVYQEEQGEGRLRFAVTQLGERPGVSGEGWLAKAQFKVKEGQTGTITFTPLEGSIQFFNSENEKIPVAVEPIQLEIQSSYQVKGKVTVPSVHHLKDLSGFKVSVLSGEQAVAEGTTSKDGSYRLTVQESGDYVILVERQGYLPSQALVSVSEGAKEIEAPSYVMYVGDFNGDHYIDIVDISLMAKQFESVVTPLNRIFDIDLNGSIDLSDVIPVARHFGRVPVTPLSN
ncbi:M14 family zinc carboxypeptidase [Ammoniphilus sp. CFH 90114]|uniref:M14 family zinc carboxypeptidase n=1 Tax=Ammoniphilus sp. CFH 90114 TaxID=2493665 RepID=UPI00100EEB89|nr:M14 family zinc carboxypeptidase [Ammoniphilus sp. CFH 90114]RXT02833.1 hypothetical protein EIZ39_24155 [Ammoniphilus sp. CFH 90114]